MISLIIPMYNNEQTIEQTLNSVVNQTVCFKEVIVIDNGSTDQSAEKVAEFCCTYPFIRLIHCDQKGVSFARNKGISEAKYEYIAFLDADDILDLRYVAVLEEAISKNPNADMYHFNFYQQFKNGIIKENQYFLSSQTQYQGNQFMEQTLQRFSFEAKHMVWSFLFKRAFLNDYELRFDEKIRAFEDILFLHKVWSCNPVIIIVPELLLRYCYVAHSITNSGHTTEFRYTLTQFAQEMAQDKTPYKKRYSFRLLSRLCGFKEYNAILQEFYNQTFCKNLYIYATNKLLYMYIRFRRLI